MTIILEQVTKKYGKRLAVDDAGFEVPSGRITGFVGANGAGKTTVMNMVVGLLSLSGGKIMADGKPIARAYQAGIGYMPDQQALYLDMSAGEQLVLFAEFKGIKTAEAKRKVNRLLEELGLADRAKDPVGNLSLGNRRKVQLASVLLRQPTALIMDEPFSGLDPEAVDYMEPILREYAAAGVPVLFSSHQLGLVERMCDRLVVIGKGRIKAEGSLAELTQGHPGQLVVQYADASLPEELLPKHITVVSHDPDAKKLVISSDPAQQAELILQLAQTVRVCEVSRHRLSLEESYRGIIGQEGTNKEGYGNGAV